MISNLPRYSFLSFSSSKTKEFKPPKRVTRLQSNFKRNKNETLNRKFYKKHLYIINTFGEEKMRKLIIFLFLPAISFLWFIGWSLFWIGQK
jgi:hypothetical protein